MRWLWIIIFLIVFVLNLSVRITHIATTPQDLEQWFMNMNVQWYQTMIFEFDQQKDVSFWMKDTPSPLDMVFLDDNRRIVDIHTWAIPFDETIISSSWVRYVIEFLSWQVHRTDLRIWDSMSRNSLFLTKSWRQ